jgi:hypothetical protein
MSESMFNYQIKHGPSGAPAGGVRPDPNAPLFASEDGLVASLSNSECIFQLRRTGEPHVMTYQVLRALDQCREFRTLDEHVARIMTTIPGLQAQRDGVLRVLESLTNRGLLVRDASLLERLASTPARSVAPMRAVFIRACDRPAQLEKLLATLTEYERRFRANRQYVLLDDSTNAAAIDRHRDLLREFARETGCKLAYVGSAEQARLIERLAKAVPAARDALPTLLARSKSGGRFGGGRGWNLALLLSAGCRFALFDDDQRLPLRRPDGAQAGLDPNPGTPIHARFARNFDEVRASGEEVLDDPFELHLEASGQALGTLASGSRYAIERTALRGLSFTRIAHLNERAHVLATLQGTYGSSRTETGLWLYQLAADSREDFWRDRDGYLRNIEAANLWYGVRQARALNVATFTPFTFDNAQFLPCTNAQGRGEDLLFSAAARLCHPDSLVLELPTAIGHVQEGTRKRSEKTLAAQTPRFNHFVADFVQRQIPEPLSADPAQRLHLLAANLRDLGGASETARVRYLREYLGYVRADLIERLQQQFDASPDAPVYWQADMRTIIESNGKALLNQAPPRLGDWSDELDNAGCADALRAETASLAAAYEAWPSLWSHARDAGEQLLAAI